jgi:phosphate starvation-inducible protein PhoH and related proteins
VELAEPSARLELLDNDGARTLAGGRSENLKLIEQRFGVHIGQRGNVFLISGEPAKVALAEKLLGGLTELIQRKYPLGLEDVEQASKVLLADQNADLKEIFLDTVYVTNRNRPVTPKGFNQKAYIEAIRKHDIVFGIGPAGTGKTYLAMAMAVAALVERRVKRIVLCRPAVEAGEKLGFLPGDLAEKVSPYLRPLYDALHDLMDMDRAQDLIERGTIEVAPLAFMRGRAQPLDRQVLTPSGFRPIGSLRVGDLVIGSDGLPTPVLGTYPQGRREVFRVRAQDGSTTVCCAEHLWFVTTPDDRKHGRDGRVIQTQEMVRRLRRHHQHRFELPVVEPVELERQDVPMDPYALGLLLGDGCITTSTTPSFTTSDPELADALEDALQRIELRRKSKVDYVLRHVDGHRGGVIVANPVTVALRELGLAGARSSTKFVPDCYLHNSPDVRLALLQGLLDTDGGPVTQPDRRCRIQYTTCSKRLADDVVFLARSLGGVAYRRRRAAKGRPPGRARGRAVHHRADAHILEIRLPAGIEPFRLGRKRDLYHEHGGGRPMRFVDSIEPAGEAETVCIQVAAEDSLYVTDDFLVTHNTLNDSFIILDEAQNTSPEQIKMFLTRLGFNSKMVVTGDITQIDLPRDQRSGLVVIGEILKEVEGIEFVRFGGEDVVRHKLVQRIVEAYNEYAEKQAPPLRQAQARRQQG